MDRHERFADLHADGCFVLPNPWDVGSAKVMASLGAEALATTSAGFAFTLGVPDGRHLDRAQVLEHATAIVEATPLPVTIDFENGYADDPDELADAIRSAADTGASGCSIEDTRQDGDFTPYDTDRAVARIVAAVEAVRSLDRPFVLCARADGVMNRRYDLDEALTRIRGYEEAGADCVYVPLPGSLDDLQRVVDAVEVGVNALAAGPVAAESVAELAARGVRRISLGSTVARLTHATLIDSVRSVLDGDLAGLNQGARGVDDLLG